MWSQEKMDGHVALENLIAAPRVFTVDGLMGTGRREVGVKLAAALGLECIEDRIVELAARRLGVQPDQLAARRERLTRSFPLSWSVFAFGLPMASCSTSLDHMTDEDLFQVERDVINEVAWTTRCVIVGWQACRMIAASVNVLSVFLHADRNARIERFQQGHPFSTCEAQKALEESDYRQTQYFKRMFRQDIYRALDYQLCIDTTAFSTTEVARMILKFIQGSNSSVVLNADVDSRSGEK